MVSETLPLEGDGLILDLYDYLWRKDDFDKSPARFFLPDTIIYRANQPMEWYFTSYKTSRLKKKNKNNVNPMYIEQQFSEGKTESDIVATYLYNNQLVTNTNDESEDISNSKKKSVNEHPVHMTIEYFTLKTLREFLYQSNRVNDAGILQKFILPKGQSNSCIRAIWSPKICMIERRVNHRNLHDKKYSVYERGVTFDGLDTESKIEPVRGSALPGQIQVLCDKIVNHVTQITYHKYRISRMVLLLKCDANDRVWLLWCSSLRIMKAESAISIIRNSYSAGSLNSLYSEASLKPLNLNSEARVPECKSSSVVPIKFKPKSSSVILEDFVPSTTELCINSSQKNQRHIGMESCELVKSPPQVQLNNDLEAQRHGFVQCQSCGNFVPPQILLFTSYKSVIEHFSQLQKFLHRHLNEIHPDIMKWPPSKKLVDAAGGIGFGICQYMEYGKTKRYVGVSTLDQIVIPPVIAYLHPTLTSKEYEAHKKDPIFLHKSALVCENCCLVYADYTTTSLERNSNVVSAPDILKPVRDRPKLAGRFNDSQLTLQLSSPNAQIGNDCYTPLECLNSSTFLGINSSPSAFGTNINSSKLPESVWQPIQSKSSQLSSLNKKKPEQTSSSSTFPCSMHPAPSIPHAIDSVDSEMLTDCNLSHEEILKFREEQFFRELQLQKQLDSSHPLYHMIESADRLAESKKLLQKEKRLHRNNVYNELTDKFIRECFDFEHGRVKRKSKFSPYRIVQRLIDRPAISKKHNKINSSNCSSSPMKASTSAEISVPSYLDSIEEPLDKEQRKNKKTRKKELVTNQNKQVSTNFISKKEANAAAAHQAFLLAALEEADITANPLSHLGIHSDDEREED